MRRYSYLVILLCLLNYVPAPSVFANMFNIRELTNIDSIKPTGYFYDANVPDTLDLAEHARLALNNQVGNLDASKAYCVYQQFFFSEKSEKGGLTWNLPAKNARVLPLLRTMCGDDRQLHIESGLMHTLLSQISEDGLMYVPIENDGSPKGTAYPLASGILVQAAWNWYQRDHHNDWLDVIRTVASGLEKIAIKIENRAYYPPESGYNKGEWLWTSRGQAKVPYLPPEEPYLEQQGLEGCVKYEQTFPMRALVLDYLYNHNAVSLETAQKIQRFCLKPGMWEDTKAEGYPGNEHGVFAGHFHGNAASIAALLDVALATNNHNLMQFVKEAYNHGCRIGVVRMGWFPGWHRPDQHNRPESMILASESCGVSDMLLLAVKLSDAGIGDYWDDVDAIVRNHLVAQQITDIEQMRQLAGGGENEVLLKRFQGGFNQQMEGFVDSTGPHMWGCCSANGAMGLYYAWHGITRFDNGVATVNLFLNRASDWMDIDSYLPYEGKVILRNKKAHTALVRIPVWVEKNQINSYVNDKRTQPDIVRNSLLFRNLNANDTIRIEFAVSISMESYEIGHKKYTVTFRGSTLVDIEPRDKNPKSYHYYLRDKMKTSEKTPMKNTKRFIADTLIPLQ